MNNNWKFITGAIAISSIYYFMFLKGKKEEQKSSFVDSDFGKKVKFKICNNTDENQVVPIFKSSDNIQNPNVDLFPTMNEFNRNLKKENKKIRGVEVFPIDNTLLKSISKEITNVLNGTKTNLKPTFESNKKDNEFILFEPENLKIDGENHMEYTMKPKTTIEIMFHYE